jgi:hypothetical protein
MRHGPRIRIGVVLVLIAAALAALAVACAYLTYAAPDTHNALADWCRAEGWVGSSSRYGPQPNGTNAAWWAGVAAVLLGIYGIQLLLGLPLGYGYRRGWGCGSRGYWDYDGGPADYGYGRRSGCLWLLFWYDDF